MQALLSLERLLLAEEGRIVHAASVNLVATDADKVHKLLEYELQYDLTLFL